MTKKKGPPPRGNTAPSPPTVKKPKVQFSKPSTNVGHRVLLYGTGGIGKTTLASCAPGSVAFIDLDDSLGRLAITNVAAVPGIESWAELRAALQSDGWDKVNTIVIDSATKAEELAVAHTLLTVKHEKGTTVKSIEGYGYGKGYMHVFETFMGLMADIDRHAQQGRNVILIAHDCTTNVPNPHGEDWLRYEPRLQSPASGKASVRLRVKEWCDHVLFLGYDVEVKEGKGMGSGTRTLWPIEQPQCMAKSRTCGTPIAVADNLDDVWLSIVGE